MIKFILAVCILFFCNCTAAQNKNIAAIITKNTVRQPVYITAHAANEKSTFIYCDFAKAPLNFKDSVINFDTVQVTAIDLVFTDFPSDNDLIKLNTERIENLFTKYPSLAKNKTIAWKAVRQTDGAEKDSALNLFHGFVLYYRPLQNKTTIAADLIKLKEMLAPKDSMAKRRNGFVTGDTTELRKQYEIEDYTTVLKLPVKEALQYLGIDEREKVIYKKYDSLFVYLKPTGDSSYKQTLKPPVDSTVLKVFDRMQWKNMLVVADVTASMYPYTGQLLYWLQLHEDERRINQFVFFNDGDDKDDEQKIIGNTGGVYITASSVFEVVEQLVFKTMSNGNGGAIPENNIEALLKGTAACNDCNAVVMIADNSSGVSDMALLKQLNKPVHIILCGVHDAVNLDYLNIARSTGGSVHIAEQDIPLKNVKEGEKIIINSRNYIVVNNQFVMQ
jgi:hypothetical protein